MIDRKHTLPIARQAELLGISRGAVYYLPQPVSAADLRLMRRIDELHLEHPFLGARLLRDVLNREGFAVGRKHVATLMRRMGIEPLYRKPNTSKKHPGHAVYPYLLRGLAVERANHVWAMDITYIPMAQGFVYLTKAVSSPARRSRTCWPAAASASAWTARARGTTTYLSSGCGARSSTTRCTCAPNASSSSTTHAGRTRALIERHRTSSTSPVCRR